LKTIVTQYFRINTEADYLGSTSSLVERRRNCLLREIISTEETYVNSLANLNKIFIQPLKDVCDIRKNRVYLSQLRKEEDF